jgi:hypothetical protein
VNDTKRILRERKFTEAYISNGGNATQAYLAINGKASLDTAGVLGKRLLSKVKFEVTYLLNEMGLNNFYLAGKLKEGLESKNLSIRVRYLDMIFKLKGAYAISGKEEEENKVTINIIGEEEGKAKEKLINKINVIAKRNEEANN